MNRENILAVADAIEKHSIPDLGFNMSDYVSEAVDYSGRKCGTSACIAGWADAIMRGHVAPPRSNLDTDDVSDWLDISERQSVALFYPRGYFGDPGQFTPASAVSVLRHLAETGEVDWDRALAEPSK